MSKQRKILVIVLLSVFFIFSFLHVLHFVERISKESLQMDFTAYYTAGKVMNLGLSPYKNYIAEDWLLWDGVAQFNHGRFLYPPIAGNFFQPIAKMPYASAKHLWNYLNLFFVLSAVYLWIKIFKFEKNIIVILSAGILIFNYFPLYTLLERGQIDGLTFLLITLGIFFAFAKKNKIVSGFFFALASLFKFYSLIFAPFLFIRKKYKIVASILASFTAIIALMYIINGKDLVNDYIFNQSPRISQYGESGTDAMRPDSWILKNYFSISRYSYSMVEGKMYISESISFFSNASLVRAITLGQSSFGLNISASIWSLLFFIAAFWFLYKNGEKYTELHRWIIMILLILIFSPFTWVMNLVWLIPVFFILINLIRDKQYKNFAFAFIFFGMLIIYVPDSYKTHITLLDSIIKLRHIAGEILILTGIIILPKFINTKISA